MNIAANLAKIREQMTATCRQCDRDPDAVRLVAIAKTKPVELIEEALAAGQTLIGESYVQELVEKTDRLGQRAEWHFVGHLQSNKAKYLVDRVTLIHSVGRLSLAKEISKQWRKADRTAEVLIQVNLGDEQSKSGAAPEKTEGLVRAVAALGNIKIRGLMTLPPYCPDAEDVRPYFRQLRQLANQLAACRLPNVVMQELSMGMTHDFRVAIEEGATLIRVGTAIFGERQYHSD